MIQTISCKWHHIDNVFQKYNMIFEMEVNEQLEYYEQLQLMYDGARMKLALAGFEPERICLMSLRHSDIDSKRCA